MKTGFLTVLKCFYERTGQPSHLVVYLSYGEMREVCKQLNCRDAEILKWDTAYGTITFHQLVQAYKCYP